MQYNLNEKIKKNLEILGYESFTEIQEKVIPIALEGKDVVGKSQTGTGKTAAFLIPIIEKVEIGKSSQALILAPTRELAIQIKEEAIKISKNLGISICAIYGGERIENQINFLRSKKPEIIVGTPGRVIDHLKRGTLEFSKISFFVLDEVDEMVNRGFIDDIKLIGQELKKQSKKFQTLLFSATISSETEKVLNEFLNENKVFVSNTKKENIRPLIKQKYVFIENGESRIESLIDLIYLQDPELAIVFASTKKLVDKINEEFSNQGFYAEKIHSDLSQKQRTEVYNKLKSKKVRFLIATDIAARGIDIERVSHVYNFDFPQDPQFYIHRIGRTGRAGSEGESLIILKRWEKNQVFQIERITNSKIEQIQKPSEDKINEIIKKNAIRKLKNHIENFSTKSSEDEVFDEQFKEMIEKYKPESILKSLLSFFNLKKKKIVREKEEDSRNNRFRRNSFSERRSNFRPRDNNSRFRKRKQFDY